MIFVTVGVERFPFDRLIRAVDSIAEELEGKEPLFVQFGTSQYLPRHGVISPFLSYEETTKKIRDARIIIAHAGAGSILSCLQAGKIPLVMPRRKSLGEHIDDHQVEFAKRMAELGLIHRADSPEELVSFVLAHRDKTPPPPKISRREPRLADALSHYLRSVKRKSVLDRAA